MTWSKCSAPPIKNKPILLLCENSGYPNVIIRGYLSNANEYCDWCGNILSTTMPELAVTHWMPRPSGIEKLKYIMPKIVLKSVIKNKSPRFTKKPCDVCLLAPDNISFDMFEKSHLCEGFLINGKRCIDIPGGYWGIE